MPKTHQVSIHMLACPLIHTYTHEDGVFILSSAFTNSQNQDLNPVHLMASSELRPSLGELALLGLIQQHTRFIDMY